MATAWLRFVLLLGSLLVVVIGPAASAPRWTDFEVTAIGAQASHNTARHDVSRASACPRGTTTCWSHCYPVPSAPFTIDTVTALRTRPSILRSIAGREQDGPGLQLPPPKLFS